MKSKGFTLVELVITIAIIIVLSTVSVPIYKDYILKSKMSEGYVLLATIRDAQLSYFNEYNNFLIYYNSSASYGGWTCNEEVLGINAMANKYITWFCVNSLAQAGQEKYTFCARLRKPTVLVKFDNKNYLDLVYNITAGSTFLGNN